MSNAPLGAPGLRYTLHAPAVPLPLSYTPTELRLGPVAACAAAHASGGHGLTGAGGLPDDRRSRSRRSPMPGGLSSHAGHDLLVGGSVVAGDARHAPARPDGVGGPRVRLQRRTDLQDAEEEHEQQRERRSRPRRPPRRGRRSRGRIVHPGVGVASCEAPCGFDDVGVRHAEGVREPLEVARDRPAPAVHPAADGGLRGAGEAGQVGRAQPELALASQDQLAERRGCPPARQRGRQRRDVDRQRLGQLR